MSSRESCSGGDELVIYKSALTMFVHRVSLGYTKSGRRASDLLDPAGDRHRTVSMPRRQSPDYYYFICVM